jgi:hypothetical protein
MTMTKRTGRLGILLAIAALLSSAALAQAAPKIGMVCTTGGPTFDLVANTGDIATPDGNSVFM